MNCRMTEFRYKDVVNLRDGLRLGYVSDVEIDLQTARLASIVIYGKARFFGIFGKKEDIIIPWEDIDVIGEDTILVNYRSEEQGQSAANRRGKGFF